MKKLTIEQSVEILRKYNQWRRGNDEIEAADPTELGIAIDTILENFGKNGFQHE